MKTIITRGAILLLCLHLAACGTPAERKKPPPASAEQIQAAKEMNRLLREQQDRDRALTNARGMR